MDQITQETFLGRGEKPKGLQPILPEEIPDPHIYDKCGGCGKEIITPTEMSYTFRQGQWHYGCVRKEQMATDRLRESKIHATEMEEAVKSRENDTQEYHGVLKDSGKRVSFSTGAVRDTNDEKGRFDLIPAYPHQQLAIHYQRGANKYEDRNWEKGITLGRMLDSAERHINNFKAGMRDEPHLIAAIWNLFGLVHFIHEIEEGRLPESLDDNHYVKGEKK